MKHTGFLVLILIALLIGRSSVYGAADTAIKNETASKKAAWTLQDLLLYAIENSFTIMKAKQSKESAEWEEKKAYAAFWPKLKLTSTHGLRNQSPSPFAKDESSTAALTLSQNLWHQGIDYTTLELAQLNKKKAELEYFQKRDQLCLNLTQEFYRYSLLVKSLEIQKNQQKLLNRQLELVSDEYQQGVRSRRDFLRFKSQSLRADLDIQAKIVQVEKSRLTIAAMAGLKDSIETQEFKTEDSTPPLLDLFKKTTELNNTYEHQLIEMNIRKEDLQQELNLTGLRFTFNFDITAQTNASDYWNTGSNFGDKQQNTLGAYFTFNWTLFDGGEISATQNQKILQNKMQKTGLRQEDLNLTSEILKLQKQFLQQKLNFKTSEESLILEQNNFHFIEGEYRQSRASYLDFINGVKDLADAQNRHWNNLFDLKQGIALYHYYRGSLYPYLLDEKVDSHNNEMTEEL